ncbi:MAG: hypothetical protein HUU15_12330 [Candidatus Brocadiae bacterium]|nr:hypothetical protein [Candidatus Brocadiia bacterium]
MRRAEAATFFAVLAGAMFLLMVMGPVFLYAFGPSANDRSFLLLGFLMLGIGQGACLFGISAILREGAAEPAQPAGAGSPREDLMTDAGAPGASPYASAREIMSSVRTLVELENWKMACQRAQELIERHPDSPEAAKAKKNLDYLQSKAQLG